MFGRRRYIKELSSMNANIRSLGERLAVNTPIQGTAADIMKLATVNIFRKIKETGIDSNIVLHVHDEIVLEVSNKDIKRVESIVKNCMENAVQLKTELKVDLKTGRNWLLE
jgi:DNA polymerase-1